jgi:hypothetical protein
MVMRFPYLDRVKRWRSMLSTMRPSSGGTGEGWLGVRRFQMRGKARARPDQAVEQGEKVRKLRAQRIGSGWSG